MVVLAAVRKAGVFDCGRELFANLARLLATFIAVDAFFIGCELLTTAYPGTEGAIPCARHHDFGRDPHRFSGSRSWAAC